MLASFEVGIEKSRLKILILSGNLKIKWGYYQLWTGFGQPRR